MKKTSIAALAAVTFLLASCIQDEKENTECDIEAVSLHLDKPSDFFTNAGDTLMQVPSTNNSIAFLVHSQAEVHNVPITIRVTSGASVFSIAKDGTETPFLNGSSIDFSDEQEHQFRVVSQDKMWSRNYVISIKHKPPYEGYQFFGFDEYDLDASGKYYVWTAPSAFVDNSGECTWKNGNPGFKISKSSAKPMDYPSVPVVGGGPDGSDCVKLETCDTGPFGKMVNMRIAAGSMFNGLFDVSNALKDPLKATQFGSPYAYKPVQLRIWLRYEPGAVFQDRDGNPMPGIVDEPDVYVVLFRNEDEAGNKVQPNGSDMLTNPYIIGKGRLPHNFKDDGGDLICGNPIHGITNEWKEYIIPIEYTSEPEPDLLDKEGYSIIISIASSWQSGYFMGAIGSKLHIDNMQLFCEERTP